MNIEIIAQITKSTSDFHYIWYHHSYYENKEKFIPAENLKLLDQVYGVLRYYCEILGTHNESMSP